MSNEPLTEDSNAVFDALSTRVIESIRLEKLSNRELVFEVARSRAADVPAVVEMMNRLCASWAD